MTPTEAPVSSPTASPVAAPTAGAFEDVFINCGGAAYTDTQGRVWQADNSFNGGNVYTNTADDIIDTTDDTVSISKKDAILFRLVVKDCILILLSFV